MRDIPPGCTMVILKANHEDVPCPSLLARVINGICRVLLTFALGIYAMCTVLVALGWGMDCIPPLLQKLESQEGHWWDPV